MDDRESMKVDNGAFGVKTVKVEYPANSHMSREKKEKPTKKINKVITGNVIKRKKPLSKKFTELFFNDDVPSVTSYIINDVIIPATKSTISDMVTGGIEMLLFGETRGSRSRRDKGKSYVSYNSYYSRNDNRSEDRNRSFSARSRATHNFDDIILESRAEASDVLNNLVDLIEEYGSASVSDLYELVDINSSFTDTKYGWTNLSSARAIPVRGGYLLELPKTVLIE